MHTSEEDRYFLFMIIIITYYLLLDVKETYLFKAVIVHTHMPTAHAPAHALTPAHAHTWTHTPAHALTPAHVHTWTHTCTQKKAKVKKIRSFSF